MTDDILKECLDENIVPRYRKKHYGFNLCLKSEIRILVDDESEIKEKIDKKREEIGCPHLGELSGFGDDPEFDEQGNLLREGVEYLICNYNYHEKLCEKDDPSFQVKYEGEVLCGLSGLLNEADIECSYIKGNQKHEYKDERMLAVCEKRWTPKFLKLLKNILKKKC